MPHEITIGGREVVLEWTQDLARRLPFRASKIGGTPSLRALSNRKTAANAITSWLWLLLPAAVHAEFPTPEELYLAIDHDSEAQAISGAVYGVLADMSPDDEKKTSSKSSHSPESNSA